MKAHLMYRDRDFDLQQMPPLNEQALTQDLELSTLFSAMAADDKFLLQVAKQAVLSGLSDELGTICFRQNVLRDCLKNESVVRGIYNIAVESIESTKKHYLGFVSRYPGGILHGSVGQLQTFMGMLKKLKLSADEYSDNFESEGFAAFFAMLKAELTDEYFAIIEDHLNEMKFRGGVLVSVELGNGNEGTNYVLRKSRGENPGWIRRIFARRPPAYTFRIADRDQAGAQVLSELRGRGINLVANALAQSADHILSFFVMLRAELAFYIGCVNLHGQLTQNRAPTCFPVPLVSGARALSFHGLYDVCLSLIQQGRVIGNDLNADNKLLVMITGANQGGKSTFLRSVGLAQLMMQCGMFVAAESFSAELCRGLFTHFKREEDAAMKSGKFDEELCRMSEIADRMAPGCILLCNESFAATNEREGSEVARQIIGALLETGIKVFFVTHFFDLARGFYLQKMDTALFLRAERQSDGRRTFRLIEGEPLPTSYGEDLYRQIFGAIPHTAPSDSSDMMRERLYAGANELE
ncbi:MAG TPA: DNA mismatch repair protein MutS [Burkholderiales bacterium]|nr:DNA mismatch repair protein MutS [Burkholderiales bacterium]